MADSDRSATAKIMTESMKEAMSGPPPAPVGVREILRIVTEMQASRGDARGKALEYSRKYPAFMEQCPALFQKACRPDMDMNMLRFMVSAIDEHDEEESSSLVGAKLAERFVPPNIGES